MLMSPSDLKRALLDAQRGNGISPNASQRLLDEGWAEWVDYELGTPIDENSPRSLLRLTPTGIEQLEALEATPIEAAVDAQPAHPGSPSYPGAFRAQPAS
ncbi:hypothetical protein WKW80_14205 [Variovorax humicola]|uniref:Uncharacterized protein n=1 Tax=Variovorax humicola TaxID=1769758 RepID=A0ABU8W1P1_9BURK